MKLISASSLAISAALLFTTIAASAQNRLGQASDSLEDSLKDLNKEFDRRGERFRDYAGSLYRSLDKARNASDRLAKEASRSIPKWQLQSTYQDLRGHMNDLARELGRLSLTRGENKAAEAVWWNNRLVASGWERYGGGGRPNYPVRPTEPFNQVERARAYATRYLTGKYHVPARDLNIGRAAELGRIVRVRVGVKNVGVRLVDVDPRSGAILADRRE